MHQTQLRETNDLARGRFSGAERADAAITRQDMELMRLQIQGEIGELRVELLKWILLGFCVGSTIALYAFIFALSARR